MYHLSQRTRLMRVGLLVSALRQLGGGGHPTNTGQSPIGTRNLEVCSAFLHPLHYRITSE